MVYLMMLCTLHTVPSYTRIDDASHVIGIEGGPAGQALAGPIF